MQTILRTRTIDVFWDGAIEDRILCVNIKVPLDVNKGSFGVHAFTMLPTALGKFIIKEHNMQSQWAWAAGPHFQTPYLRSKARIAFAAAGLVLPGFPGY